MKKNSKKILFFVNSLDFFVSHRLPLIGLAKDMMIDPVVCAPLKKIRKDELKELNLNLINIDIMRSRKNLIYELLLIFQLTKIIIKEKPSLVHLITIKPVLYGGIISFFFRRIKFISSITGLGSSLLENNFSSFLVKFIYKITTFSKNINFIVQNEDDKKFLLKLNNKILNKIFLIPGSGYNKKLFYFSPEKKQKPVICFAGRLLKHKGIYEFIEAIKKLRKKKYDNEFIIAGKIDNLNPSSISIEELKNWEKENLIKYIGFQKNLSEFFKSINIFVMPSYREGFSKVLLEAAACGKAIVTTNVPGCRDIIKDSVGGLLVEAGDSENLSQSIELLINQKDLRSKYGKSCADFVIKNFTIEKILSNYKKLYFKLLNV